MTATIDMDYIAQSIKTYLDKAFAENRIGKQLYEMASATTVKNIKAWVEDETINQISPNYRQGLLAAVEAGKWEEIVNAYWKALSFGTGGIRGMMAFDKASIIQLKENGLDAPILKGPNTINNIVLLKTSAGVAKFGNEKGYNRIVIGYDSRVRGKDLAIDIARLFIAYGFTVYLFDAPCPYPEVTFAIPHEGIKAHMGILVSASHNDYRYNGYKLSCGNGSQFDPEERHEMYNDYIKTAQFSDMKLADTSQLNDNQLYFLGGGSPLEGFDYFGLEKNLIDIHLAHQNHVKKFLLLNNGKEKCLSIGFCAYHGAGKVVVPSLLKEVGFEEVNSITYNGLNDLNGLFPSFNSDPGMERQPDPGDPRAAAIAVEGYKHDYPKKWRHTDIILSTDPDADRCGVIVRVPSYLKEDYDGEDFVLLSADELWSLLLWYRLKFDRQIDRKQSFIVLSHTTTDCITKIALKYGLGVIKTWVGFASLSASVRLSWDGKLDYTIKEGRSKDYQELQHPIIYDIHNMDDRRINNIGAFEQSNGFTILGKPPKDKYSMGTDGHVRDKDGTFAAILMAEVAEWAKQSDTTIFELLDKYIYLDPDIGLYVNYYEPDPMDGEYPGIRGDEVKKAILLRALALYAKAQKETISIGDFEVKSSIIYRTGKYDHVYPPTDTFQFPDEGIRFYFDEELQSHLTIRPSGTGNALRFHVQLHQYVNNQNVRSQKKVLRAKAKGIVDDLRNLLDAPRENNY